ncbi:MAG: oligosaccharide flippase family protein [Hyphomicrobiales bacterium]|nr:oligosaccharide flippase family protein [Hyphomicrobiales bacterium]
MQVLLAFAVNAAFNLVIGLLVARFLGPAEYGRFALAVTLGLVLQAALLDWLRLSTIRFYSEKTRAEAPHIRATLNYGAIVLCLGLALVAAVIFLSGIEIGLPSALLALGVTTAIANGLIDFAMAILRARFANALYLRLILFKNVFSLALTVGGAFLFHSAAIALSGAIASIFGSLILSRGALLDADARPRDADGAEAALFLRYSAPIVAANLLYLAIPLVNRSLVAIHYGFAETGQFSLAYDIGLRAIQTIGAALDTVLFQIAVAAQDLHGRDRARVQIARNMTIVLAIAAPATLGLVMTLPSVEAILAPPEYRGPFAHYLSLMAPGLFCLVVMLFAINPVFQIEKRTAPMVGAAMIGALGTPLFDWAITRFVPPAANAAHLAIAQSCAYGAALAALLIFARTMRPLWPRGRDVAAIALALAAMAGALASTRSWAPSLATLVAQMAIGAGVYGALAFGLDVAQLRAPALARARAFLGARQSRDG